VQTASVTFLVERHRTAQRKTERRMGTHRFKIDGQDFEVVVGTRMGSRVDVSVNGKAYAVEIEASATPAASAGAATQATSVTTPVAAPVAAPLVPAPVAPAEPIGGGAGEVRAPISGVVLSLEVAVGDQVEPSSKVLVLEAMKMENEIFAAATGKIAMIHVEAQQEVREGDLLVTIR